MTNLKNNEIIYIIYYNTPYKKVMIDKCRVRIYKDYGFTIRLAICMGKPGYWDLASRNGEIYVPGVFAIITRKYPKNYEKLYFLHRTEAAL